MGTVLRMTMIWELPSGTARATSSQAEPSSGAVELSVAPEGRADTDEGGLGLGDGGRQVGCAPKRAEAVGGLEAGVEVGLADGGHATIARFDDVAATVDTDDPPSGRRDRGGDDRADVAEAEHANGASLTVQHAGSLVAIPGIAVVVFISYVGGRAICRTGCDMARPQWPRTVARLRFDAETPHGP